MRLMEVHAKRQGQDAATRRHAESIRAAYRRRRSRGGRRRRRLESHERPLPSARTSARRPAQQPDGERPRASRARPCLRERSGAQRRDREAHTLSSTSGNSKPPSAAQIPFETCTLIIAAPTRTVPTGVRSPATSEMPAASSAEPARTAATPRPDAEALEARPRAAMTGPRATAAVSSRGHELPQQEFWAYRAPLEREEHAARVLRAAHEPVGGEGARAR
jgi:hypothetical protein